MKKEKTQLTYNESVHLMGWIWTYMAVLMLTLVPIAVCIYFDAWPPIAGVLKGLLGVAPIFWTVGVIELITYVPMLGSGGSYLAFVTGNLSNLKAPCALNCMESAGVKAGTDEGEVVSTLSVATSAIVTTVIIAVGVLGLSFIRPVLESPVLAPAFDNILPALFGGLAVVFISKNWKIAIVPLIFMVVLFLLVPSLAGSVGILVPVGSIIAIIVARILYKKGKI